jgi:DNA-directed RNA polymerase alpha subunit
MDTNTKLFKTLNKVEVSSCTLIQDCNLTTKTKKILINEKINTIKQLSSYSFSHLKKIRGLGLMTLQELKHFSKNNNLSFNND